MQEPGLGPNPARCPATEATTGPVDEPRRYSQKWFQEYRATRTTPTPHGTQNGYVNWSCRCDECREAHRIHVAEWRAKR